MPVQLAMAQDSHARIVAKNILLASPRMEGTDAISHLGGVVSAKACRMGADK